MNWISDGPIIMTLILSWMLSKVLLIRKAALHVIWFNFVRHEWFQLWFELFASVSAPPSAVLLILSSSFQIKTTLFPFFISTEWTGPDSSSGPFGSSVAPCWCAPQHHRTVVMHVLQLLLRTGEQVLLHTPTVGHKWLFCRGACSNIPDNLLCLCLMVNEGDYPLLIHLKEMWGGRKYEREMFLTGCLMNFLNFLNINDT